MFIARLSLAYYKTLFVHNTIFRTMSDATPSLKIAVLNVGKWTKSKEIEKILKSLDLPFTSLKKPNGVDLARIGFAVCFVFVVYSLQDI